MKHVIIGAGAAGITAAKTIRKLQPLDEIVLISEDKHITSRCLLHKYVSGERDVDKLSFVPPNFFDDNRIEWQSGARVTGIDTVAQIIYCGDANTSYDKLLIATGAEGVFPPIAALSTAANVFGFRHFSDAQAIRQAALLARRIVVTGAGLAGLDAAYALLRMKKDVTVVESFPHIMALNLDKRAAEAYQDRFETAGCKFCFGRKVTDASLSNTGNIVQVVLDDG
ncbi:MAG: NAD(P)/FAD-dependent oxidoreductase, partial [Clostridiales bacterium]|nr:NAD(P)/FAD-dependent oxidoreductase [Clostridiales bacterium]